ncbi:hypothetical protein H6P81_008788 [Aristolochia fimbriata]|uniref:Uncharacterized protein n=1 Tax=Aristolochia fimbriata TaxID=158543 RepID=A0AAV7EJ14_ARIFI|nr:hypothetical protein H6P81_008788 [Aristolochia fimbriata]
MPESRRSASFRGCCTSEKIRLDVPRSSYTLHSPIARGSESVVYEATLDGGKVAAKKPVLSTSYHLDKFHSELQLLCFAAFYFFLASFMCLSGSCSRKDLIIADVFVWAEVLWIILDYSASRTM